MFIVIKKSRIILIILLIAILVVGTVLCFNGNVVSAFSIKKKIPIYCVETSEKKVALSFDAAWGADKTSEIMDILEEYEMKATFFLVGFWIDKYPEKTKEIYDRGFLIGNHSTNHPHCNKLTKEDITKEIITTNQKIKQITGNNPKYFRAPFGEYNNTLLESIEELNMKCIQWDVDSLDWKGLSGAEIASRILPKVKNGSIILCHNNSDHILEALPIVLLGLKNKGYTSVVMEELVIEGEYYIDNNGMQQVKNQ